MLAGRAGRDEECFGWEYLFWEGMFMSCRQFVVDAFADACFKGNPAAVCVLDDWPEDGWLQAVAMENNLSETAFLVREAAGYRLRWFTPKAEVDLCGHATLATAHVLYAHLAYSAPKVEFKTRSGLLSVAQVGAGEYRLDFPARHAQPCASSPELMAALGAEPVALLETDVYLAVFADEAQIVALQPDMAGLLALPRRSVIATAPGREVDFVSRYFAPKMGVPEDPVTGSAHCVLTPFWGVRLGKTVLEARQLSARGGSLRCEWREPRVGLTGKAVTSS